jgi:hypothetical protein
VTPATAFFLTESVRHARSLPHPEMMAYLGGLSQATDQDPDFEGVRSIYRNMTRCEDQLELIASGQLRLDLADREATSKARKGRK